MQMPIKMKSFLFGIGRLLDVGATFNSVHASRTDNDANLDALALSQDWNAVGDDIRRSIAIIESERRVA